MPSRHVSPALRRFDETAVGVLKHLLGGPDAEQAEVAEAAARYDVASAA
jgi:hypothetical protein